MRHDIPYPDGYIEDILREVRSIAVVGASPNPARPSHQVMRALIAAGYEVYPVNPRPGLTQILGRPVSPTLAALDPPVDMVDVFRRSDALRGVAEQAVAAGAKVLWSQLGVSDPEAAKIAEAAGLKVVMNRCPKIELARLGL